MVDINTEEEIKLRRKHFVSQVTLNQGFDGAKQARSESGDSEYESVAVAKIPPPPPIPLNDAFNHSDSKYGLANERAERSRPHVNAVVQPIHRELKTVPFNASQLNDAKRRLRSVNGSENGASEIKPNVLNNSETEHLRQEMNNLQQMIDMLKANERALSIKSTQRRNSDGSWTVIPKGHAINNNERNPNVASDNDSSEQPPIPPRPKPKVREIEQSRPVNPPQTVRPPKQTSTPPRGFDTSLLGDDKFREWMSNLISDNLERRTNVGSVDDQPQYDKRHKIELKGKSSALKKGPLSIISDTKSRISAKSSATRRSLTKSMKSVIFRSTNEEEVTSEVSSNDIADVNEGEIQGIDHTCDKFMIHGPFIDNELNVFHALCNEYAKATEMTFGKRSPFSRTRPHHERVYALIGSDKRSKWLNRKDWTAGITEFKLLDFLFRKTIRSKSRTIKMPKMALEHLEEGKPLTPTRLRKIMMKSFDRRDQLMKNIIGNISDFDRLA